MNPEHIGIIGVIVLLIVMFARMDIGLAMATVGFLGYICVAGMKGALAMAGTTPYSTIVFYSFTVIPLFIFMGAVVSNTGMGSELYRSAYKWIGQFKGGLAMATVVACALFAAMCGDSTAETLTIGKISLSEMKKYKYSDALACGCIACGGTLAILIPPSIGFIMYGIITETSIGLLFMAGILPGILLATLFIVTIWLWTVRVPTAAVAGPKTTIKEKVVSLKGTWMTVVLFLIVLGGIYLGIFTPTEAGAVGAFGAIVITMAARKLSRKNLVESIIEAGTTTASIMILMMGAYIFMRFLAVSKLPYVMSDFIAGLHVSKYLVFAIVVVIYLILGMFTDIVACTLLTVPIIFPIMKAIGFDPIWFGVQVVILIEMGLITPPVGMNVFILATITKTPMSTIFKGVAPFALAMLVCVLILTIFPQIALVIPNSM
jgi:C4-dicarboxylate transporter, DctM subunit